MMASLPEAAIEIMDPTQWRSVLRTVLRSRWTFAALQVLDLLTTLAAFHVGAFEVNPLVARLTVEFGRVRGLLIGKLMAVAIAMGVRRLTWVVNLFYIAVVGWNVIVLIVLFANQH